MFRTSLALVVTLAVFSSALSISATPVQAQEQPIIDATTEPAPAHTVTEPAPTDTTTTEPAPTDTVTDPAPADAVTKPVPTDATTTDPAPQAPTTEPYSEPTSGPTSEAEPQLIPESTTGLTDPGSTTPTTATITADDLVASVAQMIADLVGFCSEKLADVVEKAAHVVGDVIVALLGIDGAPKPVGELIEQIDDVVADLTQALGALLGGDGTPGPADNVIELIGGVVANLGQTLSGTLEALLGGGDAPGPSSTPTVQPFASYWYPEQIAGLTEGVGGAAGNLAQAVGRALGGGGSPTPTHKPFTPPVAPPVPVVPSGPALASFSPFLSAAGSTAGASQQLFFVLVPFSVALLQGGKLLWHRRESLGPYSALLLAIERPGYVTPLLEVCPLARLQSCADTSSVEDGE